MPKFLRDWIQNKFSVSCKRISSRRETMAETVAHDDDNYDRAKEVKDFDDSKIGVQGLVDSGITSIPRFFVHPPETLSLLAAADADTSSVGIPVVDLSGDRPLVVDQIREASRTLGFFQVTNHGIPSDLLDGLISSIKAFNEQPFDIKSKHYNRDSSNGVSFSTNFDLFHSRAANWRDTLQVRLGPEPPDADRIPEVCRQKIAEWDQHTAVLGETLMGMLSEGLGLEKERLKKMSCLEWRVLVGHYYPYCPEPDRTVGITSHTDAGVLTVLLQDQIGGLQVKHGDGWVNVKPLAGALVINIGDVMQILSNEEYKSVHHRVLANPFREPRISIAVFFNPGKREDLYGPLPEVISPQKPALYRQFTLSEFMRRFFSKELDGKSLINYFRL